MSRDESSFNTYNYGDAAYWDARYVAEAEIGHFDWYQRYSALRPFVRFYVPDFSSPILVVGCGNALMSEDKANDGYRDIMNIDVSSMAVHMMSRKYEGIPHLKYMRMDVRDMSFFSDVCFDFVLDKGTLDSLMACGLPCPQVVYNTFLRVFIWSDCLCGLKCGADAPASAAQMLRETSQGWRSIHADNLW